MLLTFLLAVFLIITIPIVLIGAIIKAFIKWNDTNHSKDHPMIYNNPSKCSGCQVEYHGKDCNKCQD